MKPWSFSGVVPPFENSYTKSFTSIPTMDQALLVLLLWIKLYQYYYYGASFTSIATMDDYIFVVNRDSWLQEMIR